MLGVSVGCSAEPAASAPAETAPRGPIGKADQTGSCKSEQGTSCGGQSRGGSCWCDESCAQYGDCCADAGELCGAATPKLGSFDYDLISTALDVDLATRSARARIAVSGATSEGVSFEAQGLTVEKVAGESGELPFTVVEGRIDVALPPSSGSSEVLIDYHFEQQSGFEGLLASGATFAWPYFCGNLFPCKSDPADGITFTLDVHGAPAGKSVVFPKSVQAQAPSYMLAWATGSYSYKELGTTGAGTKVGVYYQPGDETVLEAGTSSLKQGFEWLETTLGPYTFGSEVASVSVTWGPGAYGGMEHHPFWHVGRDSMGDETTHVHEAAHGWFGDGVRIRCWEDFVLSEGTVSYLTARAIGGAKGASAEQDVWGDYQTRLTQAVASKDHVAWPSTCNEVDVLKDLFTSIPYMKGAFFYRAVAGEVGAEKLDQVIADFYVAHVGKAAGMQDMLDAIHAKTGFDPEPLANVWLKKTGVPGN